MSYAETIRGLAGDTERRALELFAAWQAGALTDEQFAAALAVLVATANAQAVTVADLSLAAAVTVALGVPVAPLGLLPTPGEPERLVRASRTLLEAVEVSSDLPAPVARTELATPAGQPDLSARVARLARAEPLTTAARAYSEGMARSPHVTGWKRGLSANACQLCRWWHRDGRVWPADHKMPVHKGCSCSPIPTITATAPRPVQR
ncbi:hypothetical protein [Geodermatophilus sp. SYSU D01176]